MPWSQHDNRKISKLPSDSPLRQRKWIPVYPTGRKVGLDLEVGHGNMRHSPAIHEDALLMMLNLLGLDILFRTCQVLRG